MMVRDVAPDEDDLRVRVEKLADGFHADMVIELIALYLPDKSIPHLGDRALGALGGDVK